MGMPATAIDCSTAQLKVRNDLTLPVQDCPAVHTQIAALKWGDQEVKLSDTSYPWHI